VVSGSSSVAPVVEKIKEAYEAINPNVTVEMQQSDSTIGMNSLKEGMCDIGMASRELKESELEAGLIPTVIAMDGIAVVVNHKNAVDGLKSEEVKAIYKGEMDEWTE
ncbi:MAG: substrate-binding domain-containing protein, partial [Anaerotignum sp.]|nr:substrate-binding domain-containing protein [Anaerotignum sp.]